MNDEDLMNIVNEIFEEIEVDDIIEEMGGESHENHPLSDDSDCSASVIVVIILQ